MTFRSLAKGGALTLFALLLVTGIVKAVDCTVDLCGFSGGQMTGLRDTFVDQVNTETIAGAKTFSGTTVISGTTTLSGATTVSGTFDATSTFSLNGTAMAATAAELNAVADVSARIVTLTADTSITVALHEGRTLLLGEVGGNATADMTLPEATGSGARFYFIVSVANASGYEVQVATNDIFDGSVVHIDGNLADTVNAVHDWTASDSDTINWDSDLTCGDIGDWVEFVDILTGIYAVKGVCRSDGSAFTTMWSADQT